MVIESLGKWVVPNFQHKRKEKWINNFFPCAYIEKWPVLDPCIVERNGGKKKKTEAYNYHLRLKCDVYERCEEKVPDIGHECGSHRIFEHTIDTKKLLVRRTPARRCFALNAQLRITLLFIIMIEHWRFLVPRPMAATVAIKATWLKCRAMSRYQAIRCKRFADCAHDLRIKAV